MTGSGQPPAAIDWGAGRYETTAELSRICEVLVAGAGPGGLVAAITLARYGIAVVLIDKRSTPSGLSRALVVSTRGMELMRRFGLEAAVRSGAADVKGRAWVTPDLASGQGAEMPLGHPSDAEAALASPTWPARVPQDHHEPVMFEHLRGLPTARIRLGCQLLGVTQDDSGVRATVADAGTGAVGHVCASYLIAADGAHSTVREQLAIPMLGPDDLADYERVEFTAPLWQLAGQHRYALYLITRPDAAGVLAPRGPGDRWSLSREVPAGSRGLAGLGQDDLAGLIQRAAGAGALRPQIERLSTFTFAAQLAERYEQGRCFLVGDAAHRMTPRGGTGMNTAIQDGFDLGWKLAWVLRGWASPELLASYERERRPVAAHNVQRSTEPTGALQETGEALAWDLGGRLPHHWLPGGDQERSTVDLIGDGLTLLAGPSDPRWLRFARYFEPNAPLNVHVIDARTSEALGLQPTGALLARPDGRELGRWTSVGTAIATAESSVLPAVLAARTTVSTNSS